MKIIVANEQEKELLIRFIKAVSDMDAFSALEDLELSIGESVEEMYLSSNEYRLISDNLYESNVIISEKEVQMVFDSDDCITGVCKKCGTYTEGSSDGESVTYSEYLKLMSKQIQEKWLCESCYLKDLDIEY